MIVIFPAGHCPAEPLRLRGQSLEARRIAAELQADRPAGELDKKLRYFEHNARRMRYARFKSLGMF